jgi:hypothetical protein
MNRNIEQLLLNTHALCLDRIRNNINLSIDNFYEDDFLKIAIPAMYSTDLDDNLKINYSIDDLKKDLVELFVKKKPTQAVAESYELETWLDSSRRVNSENRFAAYKKLLIKEGKGNIIEQMDADTYKILDSCHNPSELKYEWDRRGLVYGHVQSGKTANYIGLINRAFDAGYKIVIVLTGMTEDLRVQTQNRIDEGVVGQREQIKLGIGEDLEFQKLDEIMPATSLKKDLKKNDDWRDHTLNTKKKSIWVIKKNKSVLENLIMWLDKQRTNGEDSKIHNVPFLVIDDEADNASIQSLTKKDYEEWGEGQKLDKLNLDDLTPKQEKILQDAKESVIKAINRNIRVVLSLMSHKTFVAYTATPYSIINQSIEDFERSVTIQGKNFTIEKNTDLFPEHFIIPITAGSKYMGIERIFPSKKEMKLPVVVNISAKYPNEDLDNNYFPTKRGLSYSFSNIPKSLEDAIIHFLITIFIRKYREQDDYNSLLVHTSHLTDNADYLADKIESFIAKLQKNLPGNKGGYLERIESAFEKIKVNSKNKLFNQYFVQEYRFPKSIDKKDILDILTSKKNKKGEYLYAPFEVVSYHSLNSKDLKHKNHTLKYDLKDSRGSKKLKNYIVVGGNRLSRGLTLEGLTTSYFVRNSTRQDSLYQMARWFGYRVGFEDLVRIYMPTHQIHWFEGVYKLEMDLRKDFEANNNEDTKMLPRDAVIKLAFHTNDDQHVPKELRKKFPSICDPNKLRNTRRMAMSFYGTTSTSRIINDKIVQKKNLEVVKKVFTSVKKDVNAKLFDMSSNDIPAELRKNKNVNYTNVDYKHIVELLNNYEAHDFIKDDFVALINFIKENKEKLEKWSLVLVNKGDEKVPNLLGDFYENNELQISKPLSKVKRKSEIENDITLRFPSILDRQTDNIFDIIDKNNIDEYNGPISQAITAKKFRNKTGKPIMLVYPAHTVSTHEIGTFPLLYCFIPIVEGAKKVTYVVRNK